MVTDSSVSHDPSTADEADLDQQPPSSAERLISSDVHGKDFEAASHTPVTHAISENDNNNDDVGHESMTDADRDRLKSHHATYQRAYKPWSLRRHVLLGFLILLLAMIIALEPMSRISQRNNGLATSSENERYLWRYGPTAGEYWAASQKF